MTRTAREKKKKEEEEKKGGGWMDGWREVVVVYLRLVNTTALIAASIGFNEASHAGVIRVGCGNECYLTDQRCPR